MVLLVAERLDGGGVESFETFAQRQVDTELPHHGFTGTGGGSHQHRPTGLYTAACALLKIIQREPQVFLEGRQGGFCVGGALLSRLVLCGVAGVLVIRHGSILPIHQPLKTGYPLGRM